jgi:hypothetical protein
LDKTMLFVRYARLDRRTKGIEALGACVVRIPRRYFKQHSSGAAPYKHEAIRAVGFSAPSPRREFFDEGRERGRGAQARVYTPALDDVPLQVERHKVPTMGLLQVSAISVVAHAATLAPTPCAYPRDNSNRSGEGVQLYGRPRRRHFRKPDRGIGLTAAAFWGNVSAHNKFPCMGI